MRVDARLASLFDVRVREMRKGEAGDAGRGDGETGVVGGTGPAGLQHASYCRGRRGKSRCCRWGHSLWYGVFIRLGQEGGCGGEVVVPLKTTACRDLMKESGHEMAKKIFSSCIYLAGRYLLHLWSFQSWWTGSGSLQWALGCWTLVPGCLSLRSGHPVPLWGSPKSEWVVFLITMSTWKFIYNK